MNFGCRVRPGPWLLIGLFHSNVQGCFVNWCWCDCVCFEIGGFGCELCVGVCICCLRFLWLQLWVCICFWFCRSGCKATYMRRPWPGRTRCPKPMVGACTWPCNRNDKTKNKYKPIIAITENANNKCTHPHTIHNQNPQSRNTHNHTNTNLQNNPAHLNGTTLSIIMARGEPGIQNSWQARLSSLVTGPTNTNTNANPQLQTHKMQRTHTHTPQTQFTTKYLNPQIHKHTNTYPQNNHKMLYKTTPSRIMPWANPVFQTHGKRMCLALSPNHQHQHKHKPKTAISKTQTTHAHTQT
jgi:hypothetical protein